MATAPRSREYVIDALGRSTAVLTGIVVTSEDGTAVERDRALVWHPHEVAQPDHRRESNRQQFAVNDFVGVSQHIDFAAQAQDQGAAAGYNADGFECCVQHERSRHRRNIQRCSKRRHELVVPAALRPFVAPARAGPACPISLKSAVRRRRPGGAHRGRGVRRRATGRIRHRDPVGGRQAEGGPGSSMRRVG